MSPTILLVNPPVYDFAAYDLFSKPLGLLYLAGFLRRAGYHVELVDAMDRHCGDMAAYQQGRRAKPDGTGKYYSEIIDKPECLGHIRRYYRRYGFPAEVLAQNLARKYDEHKPVAVLVGSMMTYWYRAVADTIKLIREVMPGTPVGLGGIYATLMPGHALRHCRPDRVFAGYAINDVCQWLGQLTGGRGVSVDCGKGPLDLSDWPLPAYDLYQQLDHLAVITSLGCPFRCDYCAGGLLQPKLMQISPDIFVEQLQKLLPLLGAGRSCYNVAFTDDALLVRASEHIIPILRATLAMEMPLRFHCPNGLHCRFITAELAELMFANEFEMIRLSYESCDSASHWQQASDNKVDDRSFRQAVENLIKAGFSARQLEAYILTGLPGQSFDQMYQSAHAVNDMGLQVRLCQYSPIPGTKLFDIACREYGIDPDEPLLHNNSIMPVLDKRIGFDTFQRFKEHVAALNRSLI